MRDIVHGETARTLAKGDATMPDQAVPRTIMPLMNACFEPGCAQETAGAFTDADTRAIAAAELHYYRGEAQKVIDLTQPFLTRPDPALHLSACWLLGYANLTLNRASRTRAALDTLRREQSGDTLHTLSPQLQASVALVDTGAATLLHLPVPAGVPQLEQAMSALPEGLRLMAAYVNAHRLYLDGEHAQSVGLAQGALAFSADLHPIPAIYLHLVCVMDCMALRQLDAARTHFTAAWDLARPDGLIEPFAEHHGLLGGMLEKCLKQSYPGEFRRIIAITYRFSYGWRRVHNPAAHTSVADTLSTTQFTCSMLASRGWTNKEIAEHLGISAATVKGCLSEAYAKLGITRREELARFMLG